MIIRWITPRLGTAPASAVQGTSDIALVDVRDLVDKAGNQSAAMKAKIDLGLELLEQGKRTVVCCDYGISRSNAVAAGILARVEHIPLETAVRKVLAALGEAEIKIEVLAVVRAALGEQTAASRRADSRSIVVTGASGFLGASTVRALGSEFHVVAPTRSEIDLEKGSLALDLLAQETCISRIIHLANPRVYSSNLAMGQTLTMLRNVIDVCVTRNIPLLYLSGWEIYSGYRGHIRADESLAALPRGPYGETKHLCELLIEHARSNRGLRCGLLRSGPVYGVGGDRPKFILNFIHKARRSDPIVTHRYMNGEPCLDLLYADDVVSALSKAVTTGCAETLNLGTGKLTSTRTIAEMLVRMTGSSSLIEQTLINAEVASVAMDATRAEAMLGWRPTIPLEQGLARIMASL